MKTRFTKMRSMAYAALALIAFLFLATSCVHEWPEPADTSVILHLHINKEMPQGPVHNTDTRSADAAAIDANSQYDLRYVIQAYKIGANGSVEDTASAKFVLSNDDINELDFTASLTIMEGEYRFMVWCDYVLQGTVEDHYYNPDNFKHIKLYGRDEGVAHIGNDDFRDAFMGSTDVEVIRFGGSRPPVSATINLSRPMSKIVFITNDLEDWKTKVITNHYQAALQSAKPGEPVEVMKDVDLSQYTIKLHYPMYMPNAFNMIADRTTWSDVNVTFESQIIQLSDTEASLGFDYVFANAQDANAVMAVSLYDKNGNQLSRTRDITIPLERGKVTTVIGSFLLEESDGGVSINPDFNGEFNIEIK